MQIRKMMIEDIGPIAEMEARDSGNAWDQTGLFTYFVREDTIMLVADANDSPPPSADDEDYEGWNSSVIGFAGIIMMKPESDILDITVDRDHRNDGVGTALFGELLRQAKEQGTETVFLEVRVGNAPARRLYQKYGFQEMGVRKNYYTNPTEDAITMRLDLND